MDVTDVTDVTDEVDGVDGVGGIDEKKRTDLKDREQTTEEEKTETKQFKKELQENTNVIENTDDCNNSFVLSSPFTTNILNVMASHLNSKNREAKYAGSGSRDLFLALHLREHPEQVQAVVTDVRENGVIVYCPKYGLQAPIYLINNETNVVNIHGKENGLPGCNVARISPDICRLTDAKDKILLELHKMEIVQVILRGESPSMSLYRTPSVRAQLVTNGTIGNIMSTSKGSSNGSTSKHKQEQRQETKTQSHQKETKENSNVHKQEIVDKDITAMLLQRLVLVHLPKENIFTDVDENVDENDNKHDATRDLGSHSMSSFNQEELLEQWEVKRWSKRVKSTNGRRAFGFHRVLNRKGSLDDEHSLFGPAAVSGQRELTGSAKLASDVNKMRRIEREVQHRSQKLATKKRESRRKR